MLKQSLFSHARPGASRRVFSHVSFSCREEAVLADSEWVGEIAPRVKAGEQSGHFEQSASRSSAVTTRKIAGDFEHKLSIVAA